jgi:hypothetical protein
MSEIASTASEVIVAVICAAGIFLFFAGERISDWIRDRRQP